MTARPGGRLPGVLSSLRTQETPMMQDVWDHIIGIAIGGILFYGPFLLFLD